jgi:phosphohistidine phosphatase
MEIYLAQHGDAIPESEDERRPLSNTGKIETERVAKELVRIGIKPTTILHSGKLRAKETAEIYARHLGVDSGEIPGMGPGDNPEAAKAYIESSGKIMFVGHQPHLNRLASLLITGNSELMMIRFRMGGVACLVYDGRWYVKWLITPEIV